MNLHPAIVHILVGANDAGVEDDGTTPYVVSIFTNNIIGIVQMARAANIKVILATTPPGAPNTFGITQMNAFVESYGAANGIPVINYADALCDCVTSVGGSGIGYAFPPATPSRAGYQAQPLIETGPDIVPGIPPAPLPTAAGYALMTQMAENTIAAMSLTLKSGYLQDVDFSFGVGGATGNVPSFNQNVASPAVTFQFTPWGLYSDGVTRPLFNSNFAGASGTWTSSNPSVMYVTQTGWPMRCHWAKPGSNTSLLLV